jgi:hypothetical protein
LVWKTLLQPAVALKMAREVVASLWRQRVPADKMTGRLEVEVESVVLPEDAGGSLSPQQLAAGARLRYVVGGRRVAQTRKQAEAVATAGGEGGEEDPRDPGGFLAHEFRALDKEGCGFLTLEQLSEGLLGERCFGKGEVSALFARLKAQESSRGDALRVTLDEFIRGLTGHTIESQVAHLAGLRLLGRFGAERAGQSVRLSRVDGVDVFVREELGGSGRSWTLSFGPWRPTISEALWMFALHALAAAALCAWCAFAALRSWGSLGPVLGISAVLMLAVLVLAVHRIPALRDVVIW